MLTIHQLNQTVLGLGSLTPIVLRGPNSTEEFHCRVEVLGLRDPHSTVRIVLVAEAPNADAAFESEPSVPEPSVPEVPEIPEVPKVPELPAPEDKGQDPEGDPDGNGEPGDQFADLDELLESPAPSSKKGKK